MPSVRSSSRSTQPIEPRTFHFQPNIDAESYPKTLGQANYGIDPTFSLANPLTATDLAPSSSTAPPSPSNRRRNSRARPTRRATSHAAKKPDGHIPRPPNCFLLYRSWARKQKMTMMTDGRKNEQKVSVIVGGLWEDLPEEKKAIFRHQAAMIKAEHQAKYPDYKYTPRSKKGENKRKAKKMDVEESITCRQVAEQLKEGHEEDELLAGVRKIEEELALVDQRMAEVDSRSSSSSSSSSASSSVPPTTPSTASFPPSSAGPDPNPASRSYRRSSSCPVPDISASRLELLTQPPSFYQQLQQDTSHHHNNPYAPTHTHDHDQHHPHQIHHSHTTRPALSSLYVPDNNARNHPHHHHLIPSSVFPTEPASGPLCGSTQYPTSPSHFEPYLPTGPVFTNPFAPSSNTTQQQQPISPVTCTITSPIEPHSPFSPFSPHAPLHHNHHPHQTQTTYAAAYPTPTMTNTPLDECATPSSLSGWSTTAGGGAMSGGGGPDTPQGAGPDVVYIQQPPHSHPHATHPHSHLGSLADLNTFVNFDWSPVGPVEIVDPSSCSAPVNVNVNVAGPGLLSPTSPVSPPTTTTVMACGLGAELFEGANLFDFEFVTRKEEFSMESGLAPVTVPSGSAFQEAVAGVAGGDASRNGSSEGNGAEANGTGANGNGNGSNGNGDATVANGRKTPDWMRRGSLFWLRRPSAQLAMLQQQQVAAMQHQQHQHHVQHVQHVHPHHDVMSPTEGIAGLGLTSPTTVQHPHHMHQMDGGYSGFNTGNGMMDDTTMNIAAGTNANGGNGSNGGGGAGNGGEAMEWDAGRRRSSMAGDLFAGPAGGLLDYGRVVAMQGIGLVV